MRTVDQPLLESFARKYIWWKRPEDAVSQPRRVMAQVMNLGTWDDVLELSACVGDDALRDVLAQAEAGQFNARSWTYWHYRLGLVDYGPVPSMPVRKTG